MKRDVEKTVVIFRKDNDTSYIDRIFALFPNEHYGIGMSLVMSYQHIGQHSGADYNLCIENSKPATPDEYNALKKELESIGYNLDVKEA